MATQQTEQAEEKKKGMEIPFFVSMALNLVLCWFLSDWVNDLVEKWTGTSTSWFTHACITLAVFMLIFVGGLKNVPIAFKGVPTVFAP
ncbi:hypothetical protein KW797_00630, partial [Candidatus Parcubacteria bacterium]|nr:hypothetical protein [Candidatus Parcubacteria bacterium]